MRRNYITCNYQGRLGNLMFEIAATLAAAWDNDLIPAFPKNYNHYYKDIDAFQKYILPLVSRFYKYKHEIKFNDYNEPADLAYKPIEVNGNTRLVGYFTTSLYWDKYRDRIIDFFSVYQNEVEKIYEKLIEPYPDKEFVSVHVRRTDYVTDYGWHLPLEYYDNAAVYFDDPIFVIFSDDKAWCEENLLFMKNKVYAEYKDYIELLLMGKCDAHIAANSTFSAMGIILGDRNKTKKVIAPKNWCPTHYNPNIWEPHWTLI